MKSALFILTFFAVSLQFSSSNYTAKKSALPSEQMKTGTNANLQLYTCLELQKLHLSKAAFDYAIKGYETLKASDKIKKDAIISIIDYSLPSNMKRLFVIDLANKKLLFNTYVSHGRNSGQRKAESFSNTPESFKSSLGFYITSDTYNGKHGYSLRLEGEEPGINDNALQRGIVMHSAYYVNENIVKKQGYAGRSLGCPALPENIYKPVIAKIKSGSLLFIFSTDQYYLTHSKIINNNPGV